MVKKVIFYAQVLHTSPKRVGFSHQENRTDLPYPPVWYAMTTGDITCVVAFPKP